MYKASEAIHDLKPVSFHYKPELDSDAIPQFGLTAEQAEKVNLDGSGNAVVFRIVGPSLM